MHFGRVQDDRGLDLALPDPRPRTLGFLKLNHEGRGLIRCGAPVWVCKEWIGTVYPETARPSEYLSAYAQHYNCVEYNGSFYHLPQAHQVEGWVNQVPPGFSFCPKIPQDISHKMHQSLDRELLQQYKRMCEGFDDRLGLSFMQLPDWFGPTHFPALKAFIEEWGNAYPLAIEFRHPDWFRDHMLPDPVINLLFKSNIATVITDSPGRRDVVHMALTHPKVMVRFQGVFPSKKDDQRVRAWMDRLSDWAAAGLDEIYFFAHQERHGAIPQTVDFALRYLYEKTYFRMKEADRPSYGAISPVHPDL
ncbi:MAG TPA: DUF72 domain-containing protein [Oligoflexus sp.]|uniref:DUF72 domain-containing protein n=1 Tax=Oligoflexus sp. TaxID=1971216 RepID=UPI002D3DBDCB|nr:DUF72 domain-containing protein [Oligoflexus sp.]HYX31621.1 DUF72 domain-containing protein [Oligoflexus sp.]